jgi:hypothetical protein
MNSVPASWSASSFISTLKPFNSSTRASPSRCTRFSSSLSTLLEMTPVSAVARVRTTSTSSAANETTKRSLMLERVAVHNHEARAMKAASLSPWAA